MTGAIRWHPDAESEFEADIDWYDERELGLGDRFEFQVLRAVDQSAETPAAWPTWPSWDRHPVVRSKGVADFPYPVVYFLEGDLLTIVAVAHTKRLPGYWRDRVEVATPGH